MKAKDLMIGFIVNTPKGIGRVVQVCDNGASVEVNGMLNVYFYQELSFVEITKEILEKIGFKKSRIGEGWFELLLRQGGPIDIYYATGREIGMPLAVTNGLNSVNMYARYFHELQLAMRLCGIDKQITI